MTQSLTYVEIDIPSFSSPNSPPTAEETYRFAIDTAYLPNSIDCIPSILDVKVAPAILSLGQDLGQRGGVEVTFRDHKHIFASESFDSGTFWGKFRGRYGLKLRGFPFRLLRGVVGDTIETMETRHYIIESTDGPTTDGKYKIIAKDILKLTDSDRAQAPVLNNGFLLSNITSSDVVITLSPTGIGDEYPVLFHYAIGGNEIVAAIRDAHTKLLLLFNGTNGATTTTDDAPVIHTMTMTATTISNSASVEGGTSAVFSGAGSVTTPDSADWTVGIGAFTVECWVDWTSAAAIRVIWSQQTDANNYWMLRVTTTGVLTFEVVSGGVSIVSMSTAASAITLAVFSHVAVTRTGNNWNIWVGGVSAASTTDADAVPNFTGAFTIGNGPVFSPFTGFIDSFRFLNGFCAYTATFTPTTTYEYIASGDVLYVRGRGAFNTTAVAHSAQDRVQWVLSYQAVSPDTIINDLLVTYAGVNQSYISTTNWSNEIATYLNTVYTAVIPEPTGVNKLIAELIEQAGLVIWWDDVGQQLRLQVLRAIATTADTFTADTYMADSLEVKEQPEKRLSQVYTYFAKINPTVKEDQINNYRSTAFTQDTTAESEYGSAMIKKVFSRWITDGGRAVAETLNDILLARFVTPPRRINFNVLRYSGTTPALGVGYQIQGWPFQDQTGAADTVPVQMTSLNPRADILECEFEEMIFTGVVVQSPDLHVVSIDASIFNVNLRDMHDSLYAPATSGVTVTCTVFEGITVGSTNTANPAFEVGLFAAGVTVNLIVLGRIQGAGGAGDGIGSAGLPGGKALYTRQAINLTSTDGEIWGGGGGGGGGGVGIGFPGGGGGGAGQLSGAGGATGSTSGQPGTTEAGGAGGTGSGTAGSGGAGGGPGLAGATGTAGGFGAGTAGGAAGSAIDGDSFVTDIGGVGDIRGSQIN